MNVKDLTLILGQSQPRISRHLKLLTEASLIERFREGSWVYFHISDRSAGGRLALQLVADVAASDPAVRRDRERADALKRERETAAQAFFEKNAADWDRMRALHIAEDAVEAAMRDALGPGPFKFLLDLGTGTGRTLDLFADRYARGLGIDVNQAMLAYARAKLTKGGRTPRPSAPRRYLCAVARRPAGRCHRHASGAAFPVRPVARHPRGRPRAGPRRAAC